jgi:hypothetical protein
VFSAYVKTEDIKILEENGKLSTQKRFVIIAEGYNLRDLFRLQTVYQEIDFQSITCDNHHMVTQFFGKSASRHKIYNEIKGVFE